MFRLLEDNEVALIPAPLRGFLVFIEHDPLHEWSLPQEERTRLVLDAPVPAVELVASIDGRTDTEFLTTRLPFGGTWEQWSGIMISFEKEITRAWWESREAARRMDADDEVEEAE